MNLEAAVMEQLKAAMKAKNDAALRTLRGIKAAILVEKTSEGGAKELNANDEMRIIQKMVKQRNDSLDIYSKQGRADLAQKEQEELDVLQQFLPAQLSATALQEAIARIISETGARGMQDMGRTIGIANKQLAGQAEGKAIAAAVKSQLG